MTSTERLIALYNRNPDAAADLDWYADARRAGRERADAVGLSWRKYSAIVAATSPAQKWMSKDGTRWLNYDAAERVIAWIRGERDTPGTLGMSARNARRIFDGA